MYGLSLKGMGIDPEGVVSLDPTTGLSTQTQTTLDQTQNLAVSTSVDNLPIQTITPAQQASLLPTLPTEFMGITGMTWVAVAVVAGMFIMIGSRKG